MNTTDDRPAEPVRVPAGTIIFAQGEPGRVSYLLLKGSVSMRQLAYGQHVELDVIAPGEVFGEMAVLGGGARMAAAVATEDCEVLPIPAVQFERTLAGADPFLRGLVAKFVKDIRASYRAFLRRPRSLRDHLRQMRGFGSNMMRFAATLHDDPAQGELAASLQRIDDEIGKLMRLADTIADKRHDIILDDNEENGLSMKSVLGSEARRSISAPAVKG